MSETVTPEENQANFRDIATSITASCWTHETTSNRVMDAELAERFTQVLCNWIETAPG